MLELLQFPFIQRAIVAGLMLAAVLAVLGIFVILRRMAFFADGIAHASLAGVAIGILLSVNPLLIAVIVTAIFAAIIFFLEQRFKLSSDVAIGILFTSGMALGVLLMSLTPGYQPELVSFLFGNILAITNQEMWILLITGILVIGFVVKYMSSLTLMSFDPESAYLSGVKVKALQLALYVITAVAVVLGIKVLGIILVSALLIIPVATGKLFARSFRKLIAYSIVLAEIGVVIGLLVSISLDLPTGPTIVLASTGLFIIGSLVKGLRRS